MNIFLVMETVTNGEKFKFIFTNKEYEVPIYIADYMSPLIRLVHCADPIMNEFKFDFPDEDYSFQAVIDYFSGSTRKLKNLNTLIKIIVQLKCSDIIDAFLPDINTETPQEIYDRLEFKINYGFQLNEKEKELTTNEEFMEAVRSYKGDGLSLHN